MSLHKYKKPTLKDKLIEREKQEEIEKVLAGIEPAVEVKPLKKGKKKK